MASRSRTPSIDVRWTLRAVMAPAERIEATDSPVPCQGLRRAHATYTPDTARATRRQLPG